MCKCTNFNMLIGLQNVITELTDMTVPTSVLVIALMTHPVTERMVIVTLGVNRDIRCLTVPKVTTRSTWLIRITFC